VTLAIVGLLASVVGAYYYLRLIKIMYFDEPAAAFDPPGLTAGIIMGVSSVLMLVLFIVPAPLVNGAEAAARALFLG
jgi:NADH-quinone oxidoreductase subunit N